MHVRNLHSLLVGGTLTLVALTSACSRQSKPATSGRSPTFESSVPSGAAGRVDEQNLCDTLAEDAVVRVEDTPTGSIIVFSAKDGGVNQPVRNDVHTLQTVLSPGGAPLSRTQGDKGCGLLELRSEDVIAVVEETADGMRLHLAAADPARVDKVRQNARLTRDRLR